MIDDVYTQILNKYDRLKEKINKYDLQIKNELKEKIKENWINLENVTSRKNSFIGIDGGMFSKDLRIGFLYIVNAEALFYSYETTKAILKDSIVGILRPGNYGKELVREIMSFLEIKTAVDCGNETADYILMDGSPFKKAEKIQFRLKNKNYNNNIYKLLSEMLIEDEEEIRSLILDEKLKLIKEAITKFGDKILWISKVSKSKNLFNLPIPDIVLLETFTNSIGYTIPKINQIKINDNAFDVTTTYVRLAPNEKVLRIDVFGRKNQSFIEEIMNALIPISIRGYPFPLLRVHSDVKIGPIDRRKIIEILNLSQKRIVNWWPDQLT